MQITKNCVVSIDYTLTDDKKEVLDTSKGQAPLVYLHGSGQIIPGLESELEGKAKGDKLNVSVTPEQGYGPRNESLIQSVPKTEFQDADKIQVGTHFEVTTEQGPMILSVIEVKDTDIVLDGNHPLAGVNLNFDVEITEVREATAEEVDHGHVHGEGGHQH